MTKEVFYFRPSGAAAAMAPLDGAAMVSLVASEDGSAVTLCVNGGPTIWTAAGSQIGEWVGAMVER